MNDVNTKQASLGHFLKNSYKKPSKQADVIDGYERDDSLSGRRVQVYHNSLSGDTKVIHRGSQDASDWLKTNPLIGLGLGKHSTRYKHSKRVQGLAEQKYGVIQSVGHSQGGFHAREIPLHNKNSTAVTYNSAGQLAPSFSRNRNKVHEYRAGLDPVSLLSGRSFGGRIKTTTIWKPQLNQHGLGILK